MELKDISTHGSHFKKMTFANARNSCTMHNNVKHVQLCIMSNAEIKRPSLLLYY